MSDRRYTAATAGPKIDSLLGPLLKNAGLKVNFEIVEGRTSDPAFESPEISVLFTGPDVDLLLANKAELLLALEQLAMEALRLPAEHHSRISFDANDYRLMRVEELRLSAAVAAERVKSTGAPFYFSPMTSRERRIIHLALRDEKDLRSESAGYGPGRQVVVYPAGMASQPPPPPPPARFAGPPRGGRSRPARGPRR